MNLIMIGGVDPHAGLPTLSGSQEPVLQMVEAYRRRRDIITDGLNCLPGVFCHWSEGALFSLPNIWQTGMSSMEFAEMLLDEAGVTFSLGVACGESSESSHCSQANDDCLRQQ
jgi:aspartate/methionine/tyrosine aminotransferase